MASKVITEILEGQFPARYPQLAMAISLSTTIQRGCGANYETVHPDKVGHWTRTIGWWCG